MRYVSEKIDFEYENGKQLQVTTIKITESKESKSIHRLDLSGSMRGLHSSEDGISYEANSKPKSANVVYPIPQCK